MGTDDSILSINSVIVMACSAEIMNIRDNHWVAKRKIRSYSWHWRAEYVGVQVVLRLCVALAMHFLVNERAKRPLCFSDAFSAKKVFFRGKFFPVVLK